MRFLRMADVTDNRTGGMTRFMHYIGDELRADGHEVECVFRDGLGAPIEERLRRFVTPLRMVDIVRRRRREGRVYDAVEIHEPSGAAYALARQIDQRLPPMVLVSYGLEHRAHAAMLAYYRKKGIRASLKRRYSPYSVIAQADLALRLADQVTVESTEDEAYLKHRLGIARDRITIVNGGITQTFLRAPAPDDQARGVLFLGSWIDRKGTLDVVPALRLVLEARSDVPFTVAGFGGQIDVAQLFPRQFRNRVHQIPRVANEEDLLAIYRRHSVFVSPSVFEGQLLTMLEAAGSGLAIVATRTCGMKDFLRDGETGLLVEPGEPDDLASAIIRLLDDRAFALRLARGAQTAARTFTWRRSAEQFVDAATRARRH